MDSCQINAVNIAGTQGVDAQGRTMFTLEFNSAALAGYVDQLEGYTDGLEALAGGGNASLASIDGKIPTLGIKTAAASISIAPASDAQFVTKPYAVTASTWSYPAAVGGILNSAVAVTIAAAAGANVRNYVSALQIMWEPLTTATEIAIRDGAGGTVLWRYKIPANMAGSCEPTFPIPLKSTANTLLEFLTLTASGAGAVYVNAQGYTGA